MFFLGGGGRGLEPSYHPELLGHFHCSSGSEITPDSGSVLILCRIYGESPVVNRPLHPTDEIFTAELCIVFRTVLLRKLPSNIQLRDGMYPSVGAERGHINNMAIIAIAELCIVPTPNMAQIPSEVTFWRKWPRKFRVPTNNEIQLMALPLARHWQCCRML